MRYGGGYGDGVLACRTGGPVEAKGTVASKGALTVDASCPVRARAAAAFIIVCSHPQSRLADENIAVPMHAGATGGEGQVPVGVEEKHWSVVAPTRSKPSKQSNLATLPTALPLLNATVPLSGSDGIPSTHPLAADDVRHERTGG